MSSANLYNMKNPLSFATSDGAKAESILSTNPIVPSVTQPSAVTPTNPWSGTSEVFRAFYPNTPIDPSRWNKMFPYRLLVIDARNNKIIANDESTGTGTVVAETGESGLVTKLHWNSLSDEWSYTLPITPQQMSTDIQFAIGVSATQQGVTEEHNGVVFKDISLDFTTGIWPSRKDVDPTSSFGGDTFLKTVFENSGKSAAALRQSIDNLKNIVNSASPSSTSNSLPDTEGEYSTGYYQALYLARFLEQYALAKKDPNKASWRLCFWNQKDNEAYIVTPRRFSHRRSAQNPSAYMCSLVVRAYRRVDLKENAAPPSEISSITSPNFYSRAANILTGTRSVLSNSINLVRSVRSDFRRPFEILRQGTLLVKDAAGIARTAADLPSAVIVDAKSEIGQAVGNLRDAANAIGGIGISATQNAGIKSSVDAFNQLSKANGTNLGSAGGNINSTLNNSPAFNPMLNPEANYDLLSSVSTNEFNLSEEQSDKVDVDLEQATTLTVDQLKSQKSELEQLALDISNQFGAGDETTYQILGLPAPKERAVPLSIDELEILESLWESISVYDQLTATQLLDGQRILNPIQYTKELANANGLPFSDAQSKISAPVPFGLSLEAISLRYLGDAKRWYEIATLNNLRSPYIDEDGYELLLLSNGDGRSFTVSKDSRLYLGQKILLFSNTVSRFSRNIIQIDQIGDTTLLITVDGDADLNVLTASQSAKIKGYLAGTVNSQDQIYLPLGSKASISSDTPPPPLFRNDEAVALSKVDFLQSDSGDIVFDSSGDVKLAAGMTNLIQALKTIILTKIGSSIPDPTLGISAQIGDNVADVQASELFSQIEKQIKADPRFSGIVTLNIEINGPAIIINLAVTEASGGGVVPISFTVSR